MKLEKSPIKLANTLETQDIDAAFRKIDFDKPREKLEEAHTADTVTEQGAVIVKEVDDRAENVEDEQTIAAGQVRPLSTASPPPQGTGTAGLGSDGAGVSWESTSTNESIGVFQAGMGVRSSVGIDQGV